jgi:hypothetical protein
VRFDDFQFSTVRRVVRHMGHEFHTNDVARHPATLAAHRPAPEEMNTYLRMTGRYLHRHGAELGLILTPDSVPGRGRRRDTRGRQP